MEVTVAVVFEIMPLMPMFIANPALYDNYRAQKAKVLQEMGVKDVDTYLPTKEVMFPNQGQQPQPQAQQEQMMQRPQQGRM